MAQKIQPVKGMNDLLPVEQEDFKLTAASWQAFGDTIGRQTRTCGYQQICMPILEQTGLSVRSIGEETDVVDKEMYTFSDSSESSNLSLRPGGTASCLRAVVEHNLLYSGPQKLWYMRPMFRRERPQKGRYHWFHQVGIEALGFEGPDVDAEIIAMSADLWGKLGIRGYLTLEINGLGNREKHATHRHTLVDCLGKHQDRMDEGGKRRLRTNPLRVLDTKNPVLWEVYSSAPHLIDYLGDTSQAHYTRLKAMLDGLGIRYIENPRPVCDLNYYNQTVFERTTNKLGAQATVCGGGRYDGLIEESSDKLTPSIGFAMGVERLLLPVHEYRSLHADAAPDVYIMHQGEGADLQVVKYARLLRDVGFNVLQHSGSQSLKAQMKKANGSGARFTLIVTQDELSSGGATLKDMQGRHSQQTVATANLISTLQQWKNA